MISLAETEIYLIRHGETTLTNAKQYVGSSDIPLSEQGKAQARRLEQECEEDIVVTIVRS